MTHIARRKVKIHQRLSLLYVALSRRDVSEDLRLSFHTPVAQRNLLPLPVSLARRSSYSVIKEPLDRSIET